MLIRTDSSPIATAVELLALCHACHSIVAHPAAHSIVKSVQNEALLPIGLTKFQAGW